MDPSDRELKNQLEIIQAQNLMPEHVQQLFISLRSTSESMMEFIEEAAKAMIESCTRCPNWSDIPNLKAESKDVSQWALLCQNLHEALKQQTSRIRDTLLSPVIYAIVTGSQRTKRSSPGNSAKFQSPLRSHFETFGSRQTNTLFGGGLRDSDLIGKSTEMVLVPKPDISQSMDLPQRRASPQVGHSQHVPRQENQILKTPLSSMAISMYPDARPVVVAQAEPPVVNAAPIPVPEPVLVPESTRILECDRICDTEGVKIVVTLKPIGTQRGTYTLTFQYENGDPESFFVLPVEEFEEEILDFGKYQPQIQVVGEHYLFAHIQTLQSFRFWNLRMDKKLKNIHNGTISPPQITLSTDEVVSRMPRAQPPKKVTLAEKGLDINVGSQSILIEVHPVKYELNLDRQWIQEIWEEKAALQIQV